MVWGNELREIMENDSVMRGIIASGEWRVIYDKKSFICMVDDINSRSLVLWKQRVRGRKDRFVTVRYQLFNKKLTKHEAVELYNKIMGGGIKFSKNINVKKYNKKLNGEKKPISEIEVMKTVLRNLKDIRQNCKTLTRGEKISLTRKIRKIEKALAEKYI